MLTNAQKQARWRARRNARAAALDGTVEEVADQLITLLGRTRAEELSRALAEPFKPPIRHKASKAEKPRLNAIGKPFGSSYDPKYKMRYRAKRAQPYHGPQIDSLAVFLEERAVADELLRLYWSVQPENRHWILGYRHQVGSWPQAETIISAQAHAALAQHIALVEAAERAAEAKFLFGAAR